MLHYFLVSNAVEKSSVILVPDSECQVVSVKELRVVSSVLLQRYALGESFFIDYAGYSVSSVSVETGFLQFWDILLYYFFDSFFPSVFTVLSAVILLLELDILE